MSEITIKIEAPELAAAFVKLADAIQGKAAPAPVAAGATHENPTTTAAPAVPVQPVQTSPTAVPTPAPQTAPATAPAVQTAPAPVTAPAAPVKAYTVDDLSRAGATLIDQGKMPQLLDLLSRYSVQAVTQLSPAQYPAFVEDLKALGAQL